MMSERSIKARRGHPRAGAWLVFAAPLALGCTSENGLHHLYTTCGYSCAIAVDSRHDGTTPSQNLGGAVEVVAWGYAGVSFNPTLQKNKRSAAAGAPDYTHQGARVGRVTLVPARTEDGALDETAGVTVLDAPTTATRELGYALLGVDVRQGHTTRTPVYPASLVISAVAYGEELLAGAPGTQDDTGAVYWYFNRGSHTAGWALGGEIPSPVSTPGARFGAALAAPFDLDARTLATPAWIAVGAPGVGRVFIYAVTPSAQAPFTLLQEIVGPSRSRFGQSLVIANFNGDRWPDLAVGAPLEAGGGRVRVFLGQSGFTPLATNNSRVIAPNGTLEVGGEFGASLAAGDIRTPPPSSPSTPNLPGLVIGVPGYDAPTGVNSGGVCQVTFQYAPTLDVAWQRCGANPSPHDEDRYGHAVAVGNFAATAASGDATGVCARGDEIAVGIPGRDRTNPSLPNSGAVHILARDVDGTHGSVPEATGRLIYGGTTEQATGRALAAEFVEDVGPEDLLIGSPRRDGGRGRVSLTRAVSDNGAIDPISGTWRSTDSMGDPFDVLVNWDRAAGTLTFTMLTDARLRFEHGGEVCQKPFPFTGELDFSGRFEFQPVPWAHSATTHSATIEADISAEVGGSAHIEAELAFNAITRRFTLTIDEDAAFLGTWVPPECNITGNAFTFTRVTAVACDGSQP